jgi:hypothetical protein
MSNGPPIIDAVSFDLPVLMRIRKIIAEHGDSEDQWIAEQINVLIESRLGTPARFRDRSAR